MREYIIDYAEVAKGESINAFTPNRGFSPDSYGFNMFYKKGYINGVYKTWHSNAFTADIIATGKSKEAFPTFDLVLLDAQGNIYGLKNEVFTKKLTDANNTYDTGGKHYIVPFKGNFYISAKQQVIEVDYELTTMNNNWFSSKFTGNFTDQIGAHPMIQVEDTLYIADANEIHIWDGTNAQRGAMQLPPDQYITALVKHPNGRDLIAFTSVGYNYGHVTGKKGFMYVIDTVTLHFTQEIDLDTQVDAAIVSEGTIYVTYGDIFGYVDGSGVSQIRRMELLSNTNLIWHNRIFAYEDKVFVADNQALYHFADWGAGKAWHKLERFFTGNPYITAIDIVESKPEPVVIACLHNTNTGTKDAVIYDLSQTSDGLYFVSNNLGEVRIKEIEVQYRHNTLYNNLSVTIWDGENAIFGLSTSSIYGQQSDYLKVRVPHRKLKNARVGVEQYNNLQNISKIIIRYD